MPTVAPLTTDDAWDAAVPILRQLWTDAEESFVRGWREEDEYELYGYYAPVGQGRRHDGDPGNPLVAVAGLSVQRVLHHRRHAWVHDLVVDEAHRGEGHGADLLSWIEDWARERECEYVALANVLDNERALSFYEENGLAQFGYVLEREL
ncbi:GNAT family N-acetyltransferase [Haloarcula marina]|uniref:GNAT family N-acetyltransferase n=1 Tax=Haloarcula marina TaxID=2961574 RepID=UPI0020B808BF|nr:GNAT family N-acetyltransferase [Halomicroarcula marina]